MFLHNRYTNGRRRIACGLFAFGLLFPYIPVTAHSQTAADSAAIAEPAAASFVLASVNNYPNLLKNSSFEEVRTTSRNRWKDNIEPLHWSEWTPSGSPVLSVTDMVYKGERAIRVDADVVSRAAVLQDVAVEPDSSYVLSLAMKAERVRTEAGHGGVYVRTQFFGPNGAKAGDGPSTVKLKGNTGWELHTLAIQTPGNAARLRIELFLESATGSAFFDEAQLSRTDEPVINALMLQPNPASVRTGESIRLTPIRFPGGTEEILFKWSSLDPEVAEVTQDGVVIGKKEGTAVIRVETPNGKVEAVSRVHVDTVDRKQDFRNMRDKWVDRLTGNALHHPGDLDLNGKIAELDAKIRNESHTGLLDTMNLEPERLNLWGEGPPEHVSWAPSSNMDKLRTMAVAYRTEASRFYQSDELRRAIVSGIDFVYMHQYNERTKTFGNWWDWEIGSARMLGDLIVLMHDDLTPEQLRQYVAAIDRFVPDPKIRFTVNPDIVENGANLLDKAMVVTLRGMADDNSAKLLQARDALDSEYQYAVSGDGVYDDGSIIQHANIAYTGSYGAVLISGMADVFYLFNGSAWPIEHANAGIVYEWVFDSFEPLIYKGAMMDMVRGRAISRAAAEDHVSGRAVAISLLRLAEGAPAETRQRIRAMIKEWALSDTSLQPYFAGLNIYEMSLVKNLMSDDGVVPRGELVKHQLFAAMDRSVHLRERFALGISMFSPRISAFEYGNGENVKGWYTGIGMTSLYNGDLSQFSDGYWATVDMGRLPGTTTDHVLPEPKDWASYYNREPWVGGASLDGMYGTAGMEFALSGSTKTSLEGKKSWFMFDNEIVALGTDIRSSGNGAMETIVENRKLNGQGSNRIMADGNDMLMQRNGEEMLKRASWAHMEGNAANSDLGVVFLDPQPLRIIRETRTHSWREVNRNPNVQDDLLTRHYGSLAIPQGGEPNADSYHYVLLPNAAPEETAAYSRNPDIRILRQDSQVHAVSASKSGLTGVHFFAPAEVKGLRAEAPLALMMKETDTGVAIAISDPTQTRKQLTLYWDHADDQLEVASSDPSIQAFRADKGWKIVVRAEGSRGKSHAIRFQLR